jgi:uncharacterized protein DUF4157
LRSFDRRSTSGSLSTADRGAATLAPGKRTLTEALPLAPVQRALPTAPAAPVAQRDEAAVHAAAAHGTSGAATPLPYLDLIQRSFGRHDASQIRAHVGGPAAEGANAMGAEAFATGDRVAFASAPDLRTAAHEAAHIVQQRAGVHLKGGVGEVGDPYEQHADAVADHVVQGASSEALLDRVTGGLAGSRSSGAAQGTGAIQLSKSGGAAKTEMSRALGTGSTERESDGGQRAPRPPSLAREPDGGSRPGRSEAPVGDAMVRQYQSIKGAILARLAAPTRLRGLVPSLKALQEHARAVSTDWRRETTQGAYSEIFNFTDRIIDTVYTIGKGGDLKLANALIDQYLIPIQETLREATQQAIAKQQAAMSPRERRLAYARSLPAIHVDGAQLQTVIAQAAYMSGDMFGVSAALQLDPRLGVAIFYDRSINQEREVDSALRDFYESRDGSSHPRVALIPTTDSEAAYKRATAGDFSPDVFPLGTPSIVSAVGTCVTIGKATQIVGQAYGSNAAKSRKTIADEWLPAGAREGTAKGQSSDVDIATWVARKGFVKEKPYAFIWYRQSGAKGGAHKELDSSAVATGDMIKMARAPGIEAQVVLIGDRGHGHEKHANIDLSEFWNEPGSPFKGEGRKMQLALFAYLVAQDYNIMNIGMRSGALEGPALLGVKTVYLEEQHNFQEGRMDQWQGRVPGFQRVELENVPTATGKQELRRIIELTRDKNLREYKEAIGPVLSLVKDLDAIVRTHAARGIDVKEMRFNPGEVGDVFTLVCKDALVKLGPGHRSLAEALGGGRWEVFAPGVRKAIRAWQTYLLAQVKDQRMKTYKGPDEGLNKTDEEKVWNAFAEGIAGWSTV